MKPFFEDYLFALPRSGILGIGCAVVVGISLILASVLGANSRLRAAKSLIVVAWLVIFANIVSAAAYLRLVAPFNFASFMHVSYYVPMFMRTLDAILTSVTLALILGLPATYFAFVRYWPRKSIVSRIAWFVVIISAVIAVEIFRYIPRQLERNPEPSPVEATS